MRGALANNWGTNKRNTKRRKATKDNLRKREIYIRDSKRLTVRILEDSDSLDFSPHWV
jgi:hypothetical protein